MKTLVSAFVISQLLSYVLFAADCINCHKVVTPNIVSDWQISKHSQNDIGCETCHGSEHNSASNVDKVSFPTPETCKSCHET